MESLDGFLCNRRRDRMYNKLNSNSTIPSSNYHSYPCSGDPHCPTTSFTHLSIHPPIRPPPSPSPQNTDTDTATAALFNARKITRNCFPTCLLTSTHSLTYLLEPTTLKSKSFPRHQRSTRGRGMATAGTGTGTKTMSYEI